MPAGDGATASVVTRQETLQRITQQSEQEHMDDRRRLHTPPRATLMEAETLKAQIVHKEGLRDLVHSQQHDRPHAHIRRANAHTLHTRLSKRSGAWAPLGPRAVPVKGPLRVFPKPIPSAGRRSHRVNSVCTDRRRRRSPVSSTKPMRRTPTAQPAALKRLVRSSPLLASVPVQSPSTVCREGNSLYHARAVV
jgi:hypothetical protein